jgi:hypothetical protein
MKDERNWLLRHEYKYSIRQRLNKAPRTHLLRKLSGLHWAIFHDRASARQRLTTVAVERRLLQAKGWKWPGSD